MGFRIGVDGGGTATRAVVIGGRGEAEIEAEVAVLGRGRSGSSNGYNLGMEAALGNIGEAIGGALREAGLGEGDVDSWGFGLAGATGEAEKGRWREVLSPIYGARVAVDEDVAAALAGALGPGWRGEGGAVLIAGTGANCFGQSAGGDRRRADGWGPLLGDRGSGYWLGEAAIRASVASHDGAGPRTSLQEALLKYFEVENVDALVGVVYASGFRRDRVAGFVPHVLEAARAGDEVAGELLRQAGRLLGATARAVLEPLSLSRLALAGGLLENSSEVRASLQEFLGDGVETCEPRFEPVVGAAFLCA